MIFYLYSESLQCALSCKFFGFIINHSLGTTSIEVLQMYCKKKKNGCFAFFLLHFPSPKSFSIKVYMNYLHWTGDNKGYSMIGVYLSKSIYLFFGSPSATYIHTNIHIYIQISESHLSMKNGGVGERGKPT